MENQALFSSKDKSINLQCRLLQFLSGAYKGLKLLKESNFCVFPLAFLDKQAFS